MDESTVKKLILELAEKLGITVEEVESSTIGTHHVLNIKTPDSKRLIGPQGDHLRAFNYVLRRMAERVHGDTEHHFMVDVNGYQLHRIHDLEQKARLLADRVRTFHSSAEMTPMTAYERMIIHSIFSNDPEISTESDGTGKMRHIVLRYKEKGAQEDSLKGVV
jgi:spoIIIJ-associated protein